MYVFVFMCACTWMENRLESYLPISLGEQEWKNGVRGGNFHFFFIFQDYFTIQKNIYFVFEIKGII